MSRRNHCDDELARLLERILRAVSEGAPSDAEQPDQHRALRPE